MLENRLLHLQIPTQTITHRYQKKQLVEQAASQAERIVWKMCENSLRMSRPCKEDSFLVVELQRFLQRYKKKIIQYNLHF